MKVFAATGLCCILAGCGSTDFSAEQTGQFPIQVTQMALSVDNTDDNVDVSMAIKNTSGVALRSITLILSPYDSGGNRTSSPGGEINFSGPIKPGGTAGPQTFAAVWQGSQVRCIELRSIKVTLMDYSASSISGKAANARVANDSRRQCHISDE